MRKYRHTHVVEAEQFDGTNTSIPGLHMPLPEHNFYYVLEGSFHNPSRIVAVLPGDWVIQEPDGSFSVMPDAVFRGHYEGPLID